MSARKKRWIVRDPAPAEFLASFRDRSPLVANLLFQRGLRDRSGVDAFFSDDYRNGLHDPFQLKGMEQAARRLMTAITTGESIAVYGDFDTDGVTAVTLLMQAIQSMGGDIQAHIPHRLRDGYGLNTDAIDQLHAGGVKVLVTVDCGISNVREVAHAQAAGIDVIVTDHHTPPDELPPAFAIVNPKQPGCQYPYKQLVGVGIAYKLVQALVRLGMQTVLRKDDLLDIVALGTVTDMGSLSGENRVLVKFGLKSVNMTQRPGLKALIEVAGLTQGDITSADISFTLGPRLNAAGRLDDALLAYQLLLADDFSVAQRLATELNEVNRRRQELTKDVQQRAREQAIQLGKHERRIVILDGADYPVGVVGLVANKLVDEFGRPVLLLERGEETSRGSARSIPGFNIFAALNVCDDLFVRYGGHSGAAGFTIENRHLPELEERLLAYAEEHLPDEALVSSIEIDIETPLNTLNWELLAQMTKLEPFGQSNPQPLLMSRRVRVSGAWAKGAEGQHLKLRLDDGNGGPAFEAIAFRLGHLVGHFAKPIMIDIAYILEAHEWNGKRTLQLNVKDFRSAR